MRRVRSRPRSASLIAVAPGVVALPGKWWTLPEEDGAVANLLCPSAWSPGGQPAFNDTFVEVVG